MPVFSRGAVTVRYTVRVTGISNSGGTADLGVRPDTKDVGTDFFILSEIPISYKARNSARMRTDLQRK